ncbi:MAG: hypothetical protein LUG99_17480 [Lachnospiraceae bacterium]|nr:hypothetical protein [Lachnospiraceae bacterium]
MARKSAEIHVIVHYPKTEAGKRELAERVAGIHAETVSQYIKNLDCPAAQKELLLDSVIETVSNRKTGEQAD